jgi:hypothetical protein
MRDMRRPGRIRIGPVAAARLWLSEHGVLVALLTAALVCVAGLTAVSLPTTPDKSFTGTVTDFGLVEDHGGSNPVSVVQLERGPVTVRMPRVHNCVVGARIKIWRRQSLVGPVFSARSSACAPI